MLTAQDIETVTFEKAVFGGYDMKSVDDFLEKIAKDFNAMQKENATLKSKMKVLVDKIEEYRSVETGMRKALMSAQSIAAETVEKAKAESEQMLRETEEKAAARQAELSALIREEEGKLDAAQKASSTFIQNMLAQYEAEIAHLNEIFKASGVMEQEKSAKDTAAAEEAPVAVPSAAKPETLDISQMMAEKAAPAKEEQNLTDDKLQADISEELLHYMDRKFDSRKGDAKEAPAEYTKPIFDDLKFGKDYSIDSELKK